MPLAAKMLQAGPTAVPPVRKTSKTSPRSNPTRDNRKATPIRETLWVIMLHRIRNANNCGAGPSKSSVKGDQT